MGKYYCFYCDIHLIHESLTIRKGHNAGWRHRENVELYYRTLDEGKRVRVMSDIDKAEREYREQLRRQQKEPGYERDAEYGRTKVRDESDTDRRGGYGGSRRYQRQYQHDHSGSSYGNRYEQPSLSYDQYKLQQQQQQQQQQQRRYEPPYRDQRRQDNVNNGNRNGAYKRDAYSSGNSDNGGGGGQLQSPFAAPQQQSQQQQQPVQKGKRTFDDVADYEDDNNTSGTTTTATTTNKRQAIEAKQEDGSEGDEEM